MAIPSTGAVSFSTIQTEFGGSNPIGLNEYYAGGAYVAAGTTGTNGAVPSSGAICVNKFHGTTAVVSGCATYTTAGTFTWVAPAGVTKVSVLAIGGGGGSYSSFPSGKVSIYGGSGGGLGYKNNYTVTPGASYTVVVGAGGVFGGDGCNSYFVSTAVVLGGRGFLGCTRSTYVGDGGGQGGMGGLALNTNKPGGAGGGGAAGYSGTGGNGGATRAGSNFCGPQDGTGGAGGGGYTYPGYGPAGTGGGVGIYGQGASGLAGTCGCLVRGGRGGSGGQNGICVCNCTSPAALYGSGGSGWNTSSFSATLSYGGRGAVRIVWPGCSRTFPSTNVGP